MKKKIQNVLTLLSVLTGSIFISCWENDVQDPSIRTKPIADRHERKRRSLDEDLKYKKFNQITSIIDAVLQEDIAEVNRFLNNEHNTYVLFTIDQGSNIPLHLASYKGNLKILKALLDKGAKVNKQKDQINKQNNQGNTPLHLAILDIRVVEMLLGVQGIDVNIKNNKGNTPLHLAIHQKNLDIMKALLDKRAKVNKQNKQGSTPLHLAILDIRAVEMLLGVQGIDVNITDDENNTPLHFAASIANIPVMTKLIEAGAKVNEPNKYGNTALHLAVPSTKAIETLLKVKKTDVNIQNNEGNTALHLAILDIRAVEMLLGVQGIDVNIKNKEGNTPLDLATNINNTAVGTKLIKAGAIQSK